MQQLILKRGAEFDDYTTLSALRQPKREVRFPDLNLESLDQLLEGLLVAGVDQIALKAHPRLDLDALSSILGFATIARRLGIGATLCVGSDYAADTSALRQRLLSSWFDIKALPIDHAQDGRPIILFDTCDWRRAELSHPPLAAFDNHAAHNLGNFSAVATLVGAHLLSRAELGADFWHSHDGKVLSAMLILGIATDCQYIPMDGQSLLSTQQPLPGMKESDWQVFCALRDFADRKTIANFQYSPFWRELASNVRSAQQQAINVGTNQRQVRVFHLGTLAKCNDDQRAIVADALLLDQRGRPNPALQASVVTSLDGSNLRISARLQPGDPQLLSLASLALTSFMEQCCGAQTFGVRDGIAGGSMALKAWDQNSIASVHNSIAQHAVALAKELCAPRVDLSTNQPSSAAGPKSVFPQSFS